MPARLAASLTASTARPENPFSDRVCTGGLFSNPIRRIRGGIAGRRVSRYKARNAAARPLPRTIVIAVFRDPVKTATLHHQRNDKPVAPIKLADYANTPAVRLHNRSRHRQPQSVHVPCRKILRTGWRKYSLPLLHRNRYRLIL